MLYFYVIREEIYVETSVWNFIFADDAPEKKAATEVFFRQISDVDLYISDVVLEEIKKADERKRKQLLKAIDDYSPIMCKESATVFELADEYLKRGIFPKKYRDDARHVAYASVQGLNAIVSWNFQHIVKLKTKREVRAVNTLLGFVVPEIITPEEYDYGV